MKHLGANNFIVSTFLFVAVVVGLSLPVFTFGVLVEDHEVVSASKSNDGRNLAVMDSALIVGTATVANDEIMEDVEFSDMYNDPLIARFLQSQTTETSRKSFWQLLKESLGLTIVGLLLICITPCLMWKNEGRHVLQLRRIDFFKNQAVVIENSETVSDSTIGALVHFVGEVSVGGTSLEFEEEKGGLNLQERIPKAILLKRTCYIYQTFEDASTSVEKDTIGGGQTQTTTYTSRNDWTSMGPQPATLPHLPDETNTRGIWDTLVQVSGGTTMNDNNPQTPPLPPGMAEMLQMVDLHKAPHGIVVTHAAHVGAFGLSKDTIMGEPQVFSSSEHWTKVPAEFVPDTIEGCDFIKKWSDGTLCTYEEGSTPENGDCKIVYEYVADGFECSFIVEQVVRSTNGKEADEEAPAETAGEAGEARFGIDKCNVIDNKCFGICKDDLGFIWMIRRGRYTLEDMIDMATQEEAALTKVLRIVCWIGLVGGWIMLFSIFTTVLSTLPLLGQLGYFAVIVVALVVGTVCCGAVTAIAYMRYRPLISTSIIVLALAIWGIVAWRLDEAEKQSSSTK